MKTNNTTLELNLLRRIALMQHLGMDYFIHNGKVYDGDKTEIELDYEQRNINDRNVTFDEFVEDNCSEVSELEPNDYNENYNVLTNEEAEEEVKRQIIDSLWAFNPSFLAEQTDLPIEVFEAFSENGKCESNSEAIERIINKTGDIDEFVNAAISADGRGHFLSSYDGNETEETVCIDDETGEKLSEDDLANHTFYIYRTN